MNIEPKKKSDVQFNGSEKLGKSWMFPYRDNIDKEFKSRFDKVKKDFDELMDEVYWNKLLYDKDICKMNIEPSVGGIYYLYEKGEEQYFVSMISPKEWKMNGYVGSFKFIHTGKWIKI